MPSSIPIPIDFTVSALPWGWEGNLPALFTAFLESVSAKLDPTFLIGKTYGEQPHHDEGPWFTDGQWWFFDPITSQYQPGEQGTKVGTIAMWGGGNVMPPRWLQCNGTAISRVAYSRLFQAIGETWGSGDGQSTFNLPPGGTFFVNAASFVADQRVPLTILTAYNGSKTTNGQGVAAQGGGQLAGLLQPSDVPAMQTKIPIDIASWSNFIGAPGTSGQSEPNVQPAEAGSSDAIVTDGVADPATHIVLGPNQTEFSIMPPFMALNFMIKYL